MQISGANLLIASQPAPAQPAAPGFSAALGKAAGFTPRDLTKPEPASPEPAAKSAPQPGFTRPGTTIDIKV